MEKRIAKQIFNRILLHPKNSFTNSQQPLDKAKFRQTKVLPSSLSDQGCYWIIGSKIIFWDTVTPKAILIENKVLAEVMKSGFELIWEMF